MGDSGFGIYELFLCKPKNVKSRRKEVSHTTHFPLLEMWSSIKVIKRATLSPELPFQRSRPEGNISFHIISETFCPCTEPSLTKPSQILKSQHLLLHSDIKTIPQFSQALLCTYQIHLVHNINYH